MQIMMNSELCKSVNRISLNLLTFGFATVDPGWSGKVMSPGFSRLYHISKGSFSITGENKLLLESGKWYLIPAGYSFDFESSETMEHFFFHLKLCDFDETDLLKNCKVPLCLETDNVDASFFEKCVSDNNLVNGLVLRQAVSEILLSFLQEHGISVSSEDYSPLIYKALVYIKQNLSMQLTIADISQNIFSSKSALTKHFRKELSMSVNEYICNLVMSEAERLLKTTNMSVLDISQKFGFSDQFYFSRKFREYYGVSPREYRRNKAL